MSVFINFKICDNAEECSGIEVCTTGALLWEEKEETVKTDNTKCISCEACLEACPAGAILVAHNLNEEKQIIKDIEEDPRTREDLMVERYGASPIDESILITIKEASDKIDILSDILVIEIIDADDTPCLINSVPISEAFVGIDYEYYKVSISDDNYNSFAEKYLVKHFPSLLVFKEHSLLVYIDGLVDNSDYQQKTIFLQTIKDAIK